jgi:hypothetical protein
MASDQHDSVSPWPALLVVTNLVLVGWVGAYSPFLALPIVLVALLLGVALLVGTAMSAAKRSWRKAISLLIYPVAAG